MSSYSGFFGETRAGDDGSTIVQKTHTVSSLKKEIKAILTNIRYIEGPAIFILRNPFEACLSFWSYRKGGHTKVKKILPDQYGEFRSFCLDKVLKWRQLAEEWLPLVQTGDVKLVMYKEMKENTIPVMQDLVEWLNIENLYNEERQARFSCLQKHLDGHFKRVKSKEEREEELKIFDAVGLRDKIDVTITEVNALVQKYTAGSKNLQ